MCTESKMEVIQVLMKNLRVDFSEYNKVGYPSGWIHDTIPYREVVDWGETSR